MNRFYIIIFAIVIFSGYIAAQYRLQNAYPGLTFQGPVDLQNAGDGTNRVFVVEQPGRIKVFENSSGASSSKTFLDITDRVSSGGEMGLLGLAFHPDYKNNGYFFVNYTKGNPRQTIISRYQVTSNPDSADKGTEEIFLTVNQPFANHNGGQTSFGPDGYLYIAFGDGGSGGDPNNNGQSLSTLLGKILRIDVDTAQGELKYAIPPDNPFVGSPSAREEIYAYGLRNPWRFSFDSSGKLWCGDVGQGEWEEIDTIQKGFNYGWRIMEGAHCYNPSSNCNTTGLTLPVHEYGHNSTGGGSITGGFVYEGTELTGLLNKYIFADYVSRRIWTLGYTGINPNEPVVELLLTASSGITSFGVDENKELYICSGDGRIYKIVSTATGIDDNTINNFELLQNYPNPFNPATNFRFQIPSASGGGLVTIKVFDVLGKEAAILVNEVKEPGIYEVEFNAAGLTSGAYYIRMNAESVASQKSFQQVIKIMYMK